jgi:hypothetical protein
MVQSPQDAKRGIGSISSKLFQKLEISAYEASREIGLSYPTVLKAYNTIRGAIVAYSEALPLLKGEIPGR